MDPNAVLFERVTWADALLRYSNSKPETVVPDALAINEAALTQPREELRVACALRGQTISFLQGEAARAARHEYELHRAYALAARLATTPAVKESFGEMAINAKLSSESWMMLANYLWLQGLVDRAAEQDQAQEMKQCGYTPAVLGRP